MTGAGLAALRIAATLAHLLPGFRVRLGAGDRTLLQVADRSAGATGPAMGPCEFRQAVACAHEHLKARGRVGFMGLPEGVDPTVDIGVRAGDLALPGGMYRVAVGDESVQGLLAAFAADEVLQELNGRGELADG